MEMSARLAMQRRRGSGLGRVGSEMSTTMNPSSGLSSGQSAQTLTTARSPQNAKLPSEPGRFPTRPMRSERTSASGTGDPLVGAATVGDSLTGVVAAGPSPDAGVHAIATRLSVAPTANAQ